MPITRTSQIDDDGSGTTGTIWNNAWKQELYGQIDAYVGGNWIDVAHNAANFTASTGAWTVTAANQQVLRYAIVSKILFCQFMVSSSTTSASAVRLTWTVPAGMPVPSLAISNPVTYYHQGGQGTGYVELSTGNQQISFLRDILGTSWVVTSGGLYIHGQWFYSIA